MISACKKFGALHLYLPLRCNSNTTKIIKKENLVATAYNPKSVEKNVYEKWEAKGLFEAKESHGSPTYSIVLPPPNITGKLHLGHALSCTIQDVIARRKRSMGYSVLWLPGTDHAGIATQGVVEKHLKTTQNINRHNIGREKFIKEVWKWKEKHGNTITQQLRTLGCSLDWSREVFTLDEKHTHAVNTAFIKLFERDLIYRKKSLVNWCNALKSTVSDIEVDSLNINEPTEIMLPNYEKPVKFGLIYTFAYKIVDSTEEVLVSTTMPETMLGDTAIAVHPDDERYKHLRNAQVYHPFRKTTIPIIFEDMVDMKFGTGAVKITPAHSKIDYQVAKRRNIPLLQILNEEGVMQNSGEYNGLLKYDCREKIVKDLSKLGYMKSVLPHKMILPVCNRTGDVIEYLPKEQWFLSCKELNKMAAQVVIDKQLKIEPEKFVKNWLNWTDDDRDWCISRQLWWGHQIPAYKCSVEKDLVWVAATDENSAKTFASTILRTLPEDISVERDTDVLDTWFSSGIYPFASLGWPNHQYNEDYKTFYPLSLMVTGHDILGFWVHRMVMLGLELTNKLPFKNVLLHGIICDSKGAKMSKSRGNVIDPIDIIDGISLENLRKKAIAMHNDGILNKDELKRAIAYHKTNFSNLNGIPECGVDALRFTLLSQDVSSHFVNFDINQCHANKLFCNKIWQSVKYTQLSFAKLSPTENEITIADLTYFDKWILSRLHVMVEKVNKSMDIYEFHTATKAIRTLIYNEFCDIYVEATKPGFDDDNLNTRYAHAHTLSAVLETSLRCLAPFMIFLTEDIIPKIPAFETNVVYNYNDTTSNFCFPKTEDFAKWQNKDLEKRVEKLLNVIFLIRELKGLYSISNKLRPVVNICSRDEELLEDLKDNRKVILNLSKSNDVGFNKDILKNAINADLDKNTKIVIEVTGDDVESVILAARDKLYTRVKKMEENLEKLETKLSSTHYLNSVPQLTQLSDKERLNTKKEELQRLQRLI